ncbi:MAG: glutamate--tRNA ligase [Bacteroidetes bacterium]|nr:glutamate--tRNA ligase [Bacteroidota bacterium]
MENRRVRVRFAPSPTGGLHMGGVRTALFNYLFAKKHGGDFLLRIEDTDQTRYVEGAEEYIVAALTWTGIKIDEGVSVGGPYAPYRQSERKELGVYKKYADQLIASGHAYYAFDTAEELDAMRKRLEAAKVAAPQYNAVSRQTMKNSLTLSEDETKKLLDAGTPYVVRLKVPRSEEIRFHDIIRGWVVVNSAQVDDKVLLKSDGMPTYHLAHIVDDYEMKISHAIRGEEWLPSAPAHILIYRYLGLEDVMPQYAHLPLILKPDGKGKLSKRDKSGLPMFPLNWHDKSTDEHYVGYREIGYFPQAFANMLALIGWNPGTTQEIFSMQELCDAFSLERVNKAGAKFDPDKTKWFNQQYLRMQSDAELAALFLPILKEKIKTIPAEEQPKAEQLSNNKHFVEQVCRLVKEKSHFVSEFWDFGSYFFMLPAQYDAEVVKKRATPQTIGFVGEMRTAYASLTGFSAVATEQLFKQVAEKVGVGPGQVMQLFRVCISGAAGGPALFEMMELLGKEEVLKRLDKALSSLSN